LENQIERCIIWKINTGYESVTDMAYLNHLLKGVRNDNYWYLCSQDEIKNLTEKVDSFSLNIKFVEEGTAVEEKATWEGSLVNKERSSLIIS
jgi:hypothetical protein